MGVLPYVAVRRPRTPKHELLGHFWSSTSRTDFVTMPAGQGWSAAGTSAADGSLCGARAGSRWAQLKVSAPVRAASQRLAPVMSASIARSRCAVVACARRDARQFRLYEGRTAMAEKGKIACLLAKDFEDVEFQIPCDWLSAAGYTVEIIGAKAGEILTGKRGRETA